MKDAVDLLNQRIAELEWARRTIQRLSGLPRIPPATDKREIDLLREELETAQNSLKAIKEMLK